MDTVDARNDVCAVVVTYNPDIERLYENISSVVDQVATVYVVDNASSNIEEIERAVAPFPKAIVIKNSKNMGIAHAVNKAAERCDKSGCRYLLTLDQDSVCPDGMVEQLLPLFSQERVGVACPSYFDKNRGFYNPRHSFLESCSEVNMAITSGSVCLMDSFRDVGGMDENLFVGLIDDDYSLMLRKAGWRILQDNEILLDHELGVVELTPRSVMWESLFRATGLKLFHQLSYRREVSPARAYHGCRAAAYLRRKHGRSFTSGSPGKLLWRVAANVFRSNHPLTVFTQCIKGLRDGNRIPVETDRWRTN